MLALSRGLISSTRSLTIAAGLSRQKSFKPVNCMLKQQLSTSSLVHRQQDTLPDYVLEGNSPEAYANFLVKRNLKKKELLESPTRFQKSSEREERSDVPANLSLQFILGKKLFECNGISLLTGPLDLAIYSQLFWLVKTSDCL